ncbi:cytochrome P450 [Mycena latifolia]|nr:cytochrome P450 [Mycena latifolia]
MDPASLNKSPSATMIPPLAISSSIWSILGLIILVYAVRWNRNRSQLPLPPGPKKLPLLGNLFDMPLDHMWETYRNWSKEFDSDIIHLDVAGTSIVVLSSVEAVRDLFEKRSSLYSDRPRLPMLVELMGWDFGMGDRWRAHRKLFHEAFNATAVKQFQPQERAAAHDLLRRILKDPKDVMHHFRHMAGTLIMDVTYGIDVNANKQYIDLAEEVVSGLSVASVPGRFLVVRFIRHLSRVKIYPQLGPRGGIQALAANWYKLTRELLESPFAQAKRDIALGTAPLSFTSVTLAALEDSKDIEEHETLVKATAANMYAAASDTTVSALGTFVFAMLANPEAQAKAQAEIDSVVGTGHLPDFPDEAALPYVSAIVKEVLRWRNVTPIAVPHFLPSEDEYHGYRIPAGSIVLGNAWAIMHDEEMYPEPHSFKPERFLLNGKLNPAVRDPEAAFGFGRRICPGRHMAAASLWITIVSVLATLDIKKLRDANGKEVEPSYEYCAGLISAPLPFECSITSRSKQAAELIRATAGGD